MTPQQRWQLLNPEKAKASHRKWYVSHREQVRAKRRQYYLAHREEELLKQKLLRAARNASDNQRRRVATAPDPDKIRKRYRAEQLKKYGLTEAGFAQLLKHCNGKCQICSEPPTKGRWPQLHIDHDHSSGRVRGLLCSNCNVGIGMLRDDPERLRRAAEYLEST